MVSSAYATVLRGNGLFSKSLDVEMEEEDVTSSKPSGSAKFGRLLRSWCVKALEVLEPAAKLTTTASRRLLSEAVHGRAVPRG